jgi:hypothetical protein
MRAIPLFVLLILLALPTIARAERSEMGGHVVHSRRAPVIAHRMVPPFYGRHVYHGRGRR